LAVMAVRRVIRLMSWDLSRTWSPINRIVLILVVRSVAFPSEVCRSTEKLSLTVTYRGKCKVVRVVYATELYDISKERVPSTRFHGY